MRRALQFFFVSLALVLGSGQRCQHEPSINPSTVVVAGGPKTTELGSQAKTTTPSAIQKDDEEQKKRLSAVAASVNAMPTALQVMPESPAKSAVSNEQEIASANLKDVWVSPEDHAAAIKRVSDSLAGQVASAEQGKTEALARAGVANVERDAARRERDAAIDAQKRLADEATKEREQIKNDYDKRLKELSGAVTRANERADRAADEARKERDTRLSYVILGVSSLLFLAGAAILILTQGKELVRGGIAIGCSAVGYSCYWTFNQPWFKWVAGGATVFVILAIGGTIYYNWIDRKKKATLETEMRDYDDVWQAGKFLVAELDKFKNEAGDSVKPLFERLKGVMDKKHRDIIHELRFEAETEAKKL